MQIPYCHKFILQRMVYYLCTQHTIVPIPPRTAIILTKALSTRRGNKQRTNNGYSQMRPPHGRKPSLQGNMEETLVFAAHATELDVATRIDHIVLRHSRNGG